MGILNDENMFDVEGDEKRRTSILIPETMDEALAVIGKKYKWSVNKTIICLLEEALKQLVREGVLNRPKK